MNNMVILIGRLIEEPIINKLENGIEYCIIKLAVQRIYKNENGNYDVDVIPVKLLSYLATNVMEHCHKGDLVGIKGMIENTNNNLQIRADRLTLVGKEIENENEQQDEDNNTTGTENEEE